jgi:hypothetical protein
MAKRCIEDREPIIDTDDLETWQEKVLGVIEVLEDLADLIEVAVQQNEQEAI